MEEGGRSGGGRVGREREGGKEGVSVHSKFLTLFDRT